MVRSKSASAISVAAAMALGALAGQAHGQVDPLAGILAAPAPRPGGAPTAPSSVLNPAPPATQSGVGSGFLSVEQAAGRGYVGAQTKGVISMASLRALPKTVAPLTVPLKPTRPRTLNGKPRIAIPTYTLAIVRQGEIRASGAGQGTEIAPRASKISTVLVGVTDEMAEALAQEANADLIQRLTQAGIEVVPKAEFEASADYARLKPLGQTAKGMNGWAVYGAADAPLYAGHPLTNAPMSAPGANIALTDVSYDLNAVILQPYLAIDYERLGGSGNRTYSGSANVSAEVRFRLATAGAFFLYGPSHGKGSGPGGALICDGTGTDELFAMMFDVDDRSDDVGLHNTFANLGLGSIYRQSKYYGVEVDPERYQALARAAYQGLNMALVSEILKARG